MTLSDPEEATTAPPLDHRRRDRSYSHDAHNALIYQSKTDSPTNQHTTTEEATMGIDTTNKSSAQASNIKMTGNKKHHHYGHHYHHHGNRPRSKSLDLHRHHINLIKTKYPHVHKHIPLAHSPIGGAGTHHQFQYQQYQGRTSPMDSTPKLKGKMWIRPATAADTLTTSPVKFFPSDYGSPSTSPASKEQHPRLQVDDVGFAYTDMVDAANHEPSPSSNARQVTDGSSTSPLNLAGPTSFDDDMLLSYTASSQLNSSSFDDSLLHPQQHGRPKIIFGESGKPIKPRARYTPTAAVL